MIYRGTIISSLLDPLTAGQHPLLERLQEPGARVAYIVAWKSSSGRSVHGQSILVRLWLRDANSVLEHRQLSGASDCEAPCESEKFKADISGVAVMEPTERAPGRRLGSRCACAAPYCEE
jgi:hypothetical protein